MIMGLKKDGSFIIFNRDNFEYHVNPLSHAMLNPQVIGEDTNNIYIKDIGFANGPTYFHLNKSNPYGDCELIKDEVINSYVNKVSKLYANAVVKNIFSLGDNIEWVQFNCTENNKNVNILVNKNGSIINANQLGLTDENGYFNIKTIDSRGT